MKTFGLLRRRSLTRRILLVQLVACALMLVTLFGVFWQLTVQSTKMGAEHGLERLAQMILDLKDPGRVVPELMGLLAKLIEDEESIKPAAVVIDDWVRYEMRDTKGALLAASALSPRSLGGEWWTGEFQNEDTGRAVYVAVNAAMIRSHSLQEGMHLLSRVAFVTLLVIVPLMLFTTWLLARFGLAPLSELGHGIAARTPDNLAPIVAARRYAEVVPLLDELNRLLEKLRNSQAVERRFFADAAHELLTPIAALRAQLHLLVTAPDADAKARARVDVDGGLQRVASLIRQLLSIARVSSNEMRLNLQPQDLVVLVQERVGLAAPRALDKGIDIALQAPRQCLCVFDFDTMATVLDNLIDNAIRYVPAAGRIKVKLRRFEAAIWIAVSDNGPGIPSKYHDKVFDRFFRVPGNNDTGSGLGLAIVAQIVRLHNGLVWLCEGMDERGLTVCIRLPSLCVMHASTETAGTAALTQV